MIKRKRRVKDWPLPRYWKVAIKKITGLNFCDRDCDCGENNQKWYFPSGSLRQNMPEWVPGWMNGVDTYEVWNWLVENGHCDP